MGLIVKAGEGLRPLLVEGLLDGAGGVDDLGDLVGAADIKVKVNQAQGSLQLPFAVKDGTGKAGPFFFCLWALAS